MKKAIRISLIGLMGIVLVLSAALLLLGAKPTIEASAISNITYNYLKVDSSVTSKNGAYDNFWEIRLYPQSGGSIYRASGESNVINSGVEIDFLPSVRIYETKPSNNALGTNKTPAVVIWQWYKGGIDYNNKATLSGSTSGTVDRVFGDSIYANYKDGGNTATVCRIPTGSKTLFDSGFSDGGSYNLHFDARTISVKADGTSYSGETGTPINVNFAFSIKLDDPSKIGLEFNSGSGSPFAKVGSTYYIYNNATSSTEICKMTNLTNNLAGINFNVGGSSLRQERLTVANFKDINTPIEAYVAGWYGGSAHSFSVVKDTIRPYITDSGASNLATAFSDASLESVLKRTEDNAKTKTIGLGTTNKSISFLYSAGSGESPISGNYTFAPIVKNHNGEVRLDPAQQHSYSGGTLSAEGVYSLTLTDLAGNNTTYEFVIKKGVPEANYIKITRDSYISPYYYEVKLPAGYTNISLTDSAKCGTNLYKGMFTNTQVYLCETKANAEKLAFNLEVQHQAIKTAKGYNYKLISNPSNTFEYTDLVEFEKAINYYSSRFVTEYTSFKEGVSPYLDTAKTVVLDNNLRKNNQDNTKLSYNNKPAFLIGKDFIFTKNSVITDQNNGVTNLIYGSKFLQITDLKTGISITDSNGNVKSDKMYGLTFTSLVGANEGFFRVQEWDSAQNMTEYVVYFDMVSPTISVKYSLVGSEEKQERNITSKDTISLYLNTFDITSVVDSIDPYSVVKIDSVTNSSVNGIYHKEFPSLSGDESGNGAGKYTFTIYDRSGNKFGFEVHLYGRPPTVKYSAYGSDEARQLTARVNKGESYNAIMNLKIFRNGEQLPNTYYEYEGAQPIYISNANLEYVFTKGGIYNFEITDNFGRVTKTTEFKFAKNMPEVTLSGVAENGKTRLDVTISLPIDCKYLLMFNNSYSDIGAVKDETKGLQYIFVKASEQSSGHYYVKVWRESDPTNYNESRFEIKKIAPVVLLKTKGGTVLDSGAVTRENVFLAWDVSQTIQSVTYTYNDRTTERYAKGEELTRSGKYDFKIKDELGNMYELTVVIDKLVSYEIIANGGGGRLMLSNEAVEGVQVQIAKDSFSFVASEANLNIEMLKDGFTYAFGFEQTITSSGRYTIILTDSLGNQAKHIIDIDKIAPTASLNGVSNNGSTNGNVSVTVADTADIGEVKYYFNNKLVGTDVLATYDFSEHGSYRLELYDRAGNATKFAFSIDKLVNYEASIVSGAMTNERVKIELKENGMIAVLKDGEAVENKDGYFTDVGKYQVSITDELGNSVKLDFEISRAILTDSFSYNMPSGYIIFTIKNFGEPYEGYSLNGDSVVFTDDGEYEIIITDIATKKDRIRYVFTIDRVPPTLTIEGVTNGGVTKANILLSNVSKPDVQLRLYLDGKEIAGSKTMKLTKNGTYKLILTDKAGNTTEYNFTKEYSLNGFSITLIVIACLIVLATIGLIIKIRARVKVK